MQTPAQGVAPHLRPHVHLISKQPYPFTASLNLAEAFRWLLEAPTVVKHAQPMAWTYLSGPQDGTIFLEWLPMENNDNYPSDGYSWGDSEQTFRQDYNGYTIELKVHTYGFRAGHDNMTQRARTRYHFVSKNPNINAAPPDPSLWLVHYHPADRSRTLPASQIMFHPSQSNTLQTRRWLESQGALERREFMLHDRDHWPMLNLPSNTRVPQPGLNPNQMQRPGNTAYPPQGAVPPNKRQRTQGAPPVMGVEQVIPDASLEEDEDTAFGDFFDHFTQRDISLARFKQHHEWIEEVFSSPWASRQIVPPDLGLGLIGELKGLTDGILEPPSFKPEEDSTAIAKAGAIQAPKEAQPFTNLQPEQVTEFNKRVEKYLEDGRAEVERMKAEHAEKIQSWKKVKNLTQAEKKLRYATWEGHEAAVPILRVEESQANGHSYEALSKEKVESVIKDVEDLVGTKIKSQSETTMITKGGLKDKKPQAPAYDSNNLLDFDNHQQSLSNDASQSGDANAGSQSQLPANTAEATVTQPGQTTAASGLQTNTNGSSADQDSAALQQDDDVLSGELDDPLEPLPDMDMNDMMDMDVDESNIDFGEPTPADNADTPSAPQAATVSSVPAVSQGPPAQPVQQSTDQTSSSGVAAPAPIPAQPAQSATTAQDTLGGETAAYHDDTFGDLTNIEGAGDDDGLIDFNGGDMGMDDSAFGDALHGMDADDGGDA